MSKTYIEQLEERLAQANRAFMQNPTPALSSSMKAIVGSIRYEKRLAKRRAKAVQ